MTSTPVGTPPGSPFFPSSNQQATTSAGASSSLADGLSETQSPNSLAQAHAPAAATPMLSPPSTPPRLGGREISMPGAPQRLNKYATRLGAKPTLPLIFSDASSVADQENDISLSDIEAN